jgi:serine/threonine-protein kinase
MGTTDYVAPEQLMGSETDHRADIYNLGATLYHLLTGRPPFTGTTAAKMIAHHLSAVPPAHEECPDVPEALSAVVERMLAKDPTDRYQTAAEVVQTLLPFVNIPDRYGQRSGKLPLLAVAAVHESTGSLDVRPIVEAVDAANAAAELERAKQTARLAVLGMIAGVMFGLASLVVALAVYWGK